MTAYSQYQNLKSENPSRILLMQIGDFFEILGDDAQAAAQIVDRDIASQLGRPTPVTTRPTGPGSSVPMIGVAYYSVHKWIDELIAAGYSVAMAEQLPGSRTRTVTNLYSPPGQ